MDNAASSGNARSEGGGSPRAGPIAFRTKSTTTNAASHWRRRKMSDRVGGRKAERIATVSETAGAGKAGVMGRVLSVREHKSGSNPVVHDDPELYPARGARLDST